MDGYFPRGRNTAIRDKYLHLINSRRRVEGEYYKVYQRPVFVLLRLKQNLVAEEKKVFHLQPSLPVDAERSARSGERESRVGKLFLANSICQMETKRYSGIALNNPALLLPAESLSFFLSVDLFSSLHYPFRRLHF